VPALALMALAVSAIAPAAAHARAFQVGCNEAELRQAIEEASFNGEEDVLWLAPACLYPLAGILIAYADSGFPITIEGNGATVSGQNQRTALLVNPGAILEVNRLTITEGRAGPTASGQGGAVYNSGALTFTDSTISNSVASDGGGIYSTANASLTLLRSTVSGNTASDDGGGIHNKEGRLTLIDSTVSGNTALESDGLGAGIFNEDRGSAARAVATLSNCTLSGNASRFGAGIFNDEGRVTVSHCTFANNTNLDGGNGADIYHRNYLGAGFFRLGHSILSGPLGGPYACARDPYSPSNMITPTGDNLIEDASCQVAGAWSGDPRLGPLTGQPGYHPLLPGSPVIDLLAQTTNCAGADQRGVLRPKDGNANGVALCDLGAYEAP
jgi:predicted outer membrane repeat protein